MSRLSPYIENPSCLGVNKLPARATLIPAREKGIYYGNKEQSSMIIGLNGDYAFRYSLCDDTPDFYRTDFDVSGWDSIDVPSMWQFRGYGKCRYTNIPYPFPFDPPYIDCENPVGYYRRTFTVESLTPSAVLHFSGVEDAFFVYVNGTFAGFSKGSRNAAEFDVSELLKEGENLLCVKVMTYSDGSYLECQDMLWANGIFRDVYLIQAGEVYVKDYRVTSDLRSFTVKTELEYDDQSGFSVAIDIDGETQIFDAEESVTAVITPEKARLWTAETPELYHLTITLLRDGKPVEIHSKKIGMLHSEIRGSSFLVNGSPVYIKGVNRHEYDCDNGRAISKENIEKELRMIKDNNLNAVRTSHYPNDPYFYELCSEIGLYVMDEADIETHGCCECGDMNILTKDPAWKEAYLDRTRRMLELDKNEPCVFIHSMGNEFGEGENNYDCQSLASSFAPDILAITDHDADWDFLTRDEPHDPREHFIRTGYLAKAQMDELDRCLPLYMQIEYGHAMGNSPGFLAGYNDYMYTHEKCFGGFVWEFKNHGFHVVNEDGTDDYLYGGDFGDDKLCNFSNFCLDGYLLSDRTPKHSWYELGAVMAPAWIKKTDGGCTVKNTYDFTVMKNAVCFAVLSADGKEISRTQTELPEIQPHGECFVPDMTKPENIIPGASYYIDYTVCENGKELGKAQFGLGILKPKTKFTAPAGTLTVHNISTDEIRITGEKFSAVLKNGLLTGFIKDGKTLIASPLEFNFMRAPIDNDLIRNMSSDRPGDRWEGCLLHTMCFAARRTETVYGEDCITVNVTGKIVPQTKYYGVDAEIRYRFFADGLINIEVNGEPFGEWCDPIPRIGMKVKLNGAMNVLAWFGRGIRENYPDCRYASPVGLYSLSVSESYTVFDRPQETGNHCDTELLTIEGGGRSLTVTGGKPFCFSAHDFPFETLRRAMHRSDIKKDGNVYLYLDSEVRGLGSASCGPGPEPEFELRMHPFRFAFTLAGNITKEEAEELKRTDTYQ